MNPKRKASVLIPFSLAVSRSETWKFPGNSLQFNHLLINGSGLPFFFFYLWNNQHHVMILEWIFILNFHRKIRI
jgi:hypothetical protein